MSMWHAPDPSGGSILGKMMGGALLAVLPCAAVAQSTVACSFDVVCEEVDCSAAESTVDLTIHSDVTLRSGGPLDAVIVSDADVLSQAEIAPFTITADTLPVLAPGERLYPATEQRAAIQVRDRVLIVGQNADKRSEFWTVVIPEDSDTRASLHVQSMALFVLPQRTQYTGNCKEAPA